MPRSVHNKKHGPLNTESQDILCEEWIQVPSHLSGCNIAFDCISNVSTSNTAYLIINAQTFTFKLLNTKHKMSKSKADSEQYDVLFKY